MNFHGPQCQSQRLIGGQFLGQGVDVFVGHAKGLVGGAPALINARHFGGAVLAQPAHDFGGGHTALTCDDGHNDRGPNRITAAPTNVIAPPMVSQRSGRAPSIAHSHPNDAAMYTPPKAA